MLKDAEFFIFCFMGHCKQTEKLYIWLTNPFKIIAIKSECDANDFFLISYRNTDIFPASIHELQML